jgi:chromate transport protein ChrA
MGELALYFLRLGFLGFGGPVALVGQMERELVNDKKWLTKEEMRESIAICQSLPGPPAIQVGIYIAWLRCGFWGAWLGGWCFILPNFVIVAALGALYVYFGDLKPVTGIFYGVSPAVIALILHSCYRLAKLGMEDWVQWVIAAICLAVTVILQAEVAILFIGAGIIGILYYGSLFKRAPAVMPAVAAVQAATAPIAPVATGSTLLFFLKAGSLTFGSGLVIRSVPRAGPRAAIRLAQRTGISHRGRGRDDQPGTRRDHRDLRRLSRGGGSGDRWFPRSASSCRPSSSCWPSRRFWRGTGRTLTCRALSKVPMRRRSGQFWAPAFCSERSRSATG